MNIVALGDVATFTNGGTPARSKPEFYEGSIPWVTGADIAEDRSVSARSFITDAAVKGSATHVLTEGSVLLVTRTSVGKVGVLDEPTAISQDITGVTPSDRLDRDYLVQFLRANTQALTQQARGATIKGVTRESVTALRVPLPSLDEQRRIAAILDHADTLRAKRRQVLAHLDTLTQSIFHDMFGDGRRFRSVPLTELVAKLEGGKSLVAADSTSGSACRVLKISAVTSNFFRATESKPLPDAYEPPSSHYVRQGDLLFSRANTSELVGAVAMVDTPVTGLVLPDKLWRLVWSDTSVIDPVYMWKLLQTPLMRRELTSRSSGTGGSMKNISKAKLLAMTVSLPPVAMQREFGIRVARVTTQRAVIQRALAAGDELFASLQSRAFRGDL